MDFVGVCLRWWGGVRRKARAPKREIRDQGIDLGEAGTRRGHMRENEAFEGAREVKAAVLRHFPRRGGNSEDEVPSSRVETKEKKTVERRMLVQPYEAFFARWRRMISEREQTSGEGRQLLVRWL